MNVPGIGLDIGSVKIKIVRVKKKGADVKLISFGSRETPPGAIEGGIVKDPDALGDVIADLVTELGLKHMAATTAVSGPQVYTRIISMPRLALDELRKAVRYEAAAFLPIPVNQAVMDICPIREYQDHEGARVELFFAAVRRSQVEKIKAVCKLGKLRLQTIEIETLALNRLFLNERSARAQAFLNIGASRSCFAVYKDGVLVFNRNFSFAYSGYQPGAVFPYSESGPMSSASTGNDNVIKDIVNEVARSSEYFRLQHKNELSKIIITGGGMRIPGLDKAIASISSCEVELGDVLSRVSLSDQVKQKDLNELKYDFAVAVGLAIRGGDSWSQTRK